MTSTIFTKDADDAGIRDAIGKVIDEWGFRYPGIDDVEHIHFYAATTATPELVQQYFQQAYDLGRHFDRPQPPPRPSTRRPRTPHQPRTHCTSTSRA